MKYLLAAAALATMSTPALAQDDTSGDRVYLGVGRWTCDRFVAAHGGANEVDQAQAAGWVLGFWSATTLYENSSFDDMVDKAGGRGVFDLTAQVCSENPQGLVGDVAKAILENSQKENQ